MTTETALPPAEQVEASTQEQPQVEQTENLEAKPEEPKKERTPEEREIARLRRRVDNLTRQKYELMNRRDNSPLPQNAESDTNTPPSSDEPLQLTRAELQKLIDEEAAKRAPTISEQKAEEERKRSVVNKLATEWGQEKFDSLASELDDAFGGLVDRSNKPKPAVDAIFDADDPKAIIEYLADPEHAAEAEALAKMPAVRAGREIARLESKLASRKAEDKPQRSKAPPPIEVTKGGGGSNGAPDPIKNPAAWRDWMNEMEAKRK